MASVLGACALTLALLGPEVWTGFARSTSYTRTVVIEAGETGWPKIQSLFSAVRLWGGGVETAYVAQAARTGLTSPPSARSRPAEQRARIGQSRLEG